jgi:hypothetical protein
VTPTTTGTPPTPLPTFAPAFQFLFARGDNQAQERCTLSLSANLPGFLNGSDSFQGVADSDPVFLRGLYQTIYVAPGLSNSDYALLQQMVSQGGVIEQFVFLGGVAVINVAGTPGNAGSQNVAPLPCEAGGGGCGGVNFLGPTQHNSEQFVTAQHDYLTGIGYGGEALGTANFSAWQPTDLGTLTNLPNNATVVLANGDGPSWAEYPYGSGRVIVTTLTYCTSSEPNSQLVATLNLLRYSTFFSGSAFTPGPTVTQTGTPTPTRTRVPTHTATPTPSPSPISRGDANGDGHVDSADLDALIEAIFGEFTPLPPGADVNGDGDVTPADIPALLLLLGSS